MRPIIWMNIVATLMVVAFIESQLYDQGFLWMLKLGTVEAAMFGFGYVVGNNRRRGKKG